MTNRPDTPFGLRPSGFLRHWVFRHSSFAMPTLLLIDDEPSIQHAFRRAFRAPGFTLVTASSAAEGLAAPPPQPPDAVILDVPLGDASGLETFDLVRRRDARIPVILITGHGTTDLA